MTPRERLLKLYREEDDIFDPEGSIGLAVERAIVDAVAEAVAAEREACAALAEDEDGATSR